MEKNIYALFEENAKKTPEKIALVYRDQRISYKALYANTKRLSRFLFDIGVARGTHIALLCGNNVEFAELMLSAAYLGAVVVPLPLTLRGDYLKKALTVSDVEFVFGWHAALKNMMDGGLFDPARCISVGEDLDHCFYYQDARNLDDTFQNHDQAELSDPYIITMTSGSTGDPKAIVFTQEVKVNRSLKGSRDIYHLTSDDVILISTPMYHSLAQRSLLLPLMIGGTAIILPKFTPDGWIEAVEKERVSFLFSVSSQLEILLNKIRNGTHDFRSLRTIVSSSALLKNNVKIELVNAFECDIHECYGASEVGVVTNLSITHDSDKFGSVGKALPYVSVKICDNNRQDVGLNKTGEIACRTATLFAGYYKNSNLTKNALDSEGFFYTGDVGYLDDDGYLYYVDRVKDIIITGGINVYPQDVEAVLRAVEGVKECAVIGVENQHFGEVVLAVVVESEHHPLEIGKLKKACLEKLTDYQQPVAYRVVESLPRSELGKIKKGDLKKQFRSYDIEMFNAKS